METYTENVIKKIQSITVHSYIAQAQLEHQWKLKNELQSDSIIFLGDFAENSGRRWSSVVLLEKFTSHAIPRSHLLYKNEKLKHLSYCVIWGDMEHDVAMVYQVQNQFLKKVLASLPETKDVKLIFRQLCKSIYKPEKFIQSVST